MIRSRMNWQRCAILDCGHIKTITVGKANGQQQKFYTCGLTGKALTSAICPLGDDLVLHMIHNSHDPKEAERIMFGVPI